MQPALYIDGRVGRIDAADRGLAYGDGLFETMLAERGRIRWLDLHLDRLRAGCSRLEIPIPDLAELRRALEARVPDNGSATIKLVLTRGTGERGYAPPDAAAPAIILFAFPREKAEAIRSVDAVTLEMRLGENSKLAGIKHLSRLEQVMAQLELRRRGAAEGLLRSTAGWVVGGASSNVFAVFGERLITPRIVGAGIRGVMRRAILEHAGTIGLEAEEADLELETIYGADELFMTNALTGIRHVSALDGRRFEDRGTASRLRAHLDAVAHA